MTIHICPLDNAEMIFADGVWYCINCKYFERENG